MRRSLVSLASILLLATCGGGDKDSPFELSREPVSVRGWINDVKGASRAETMEMEVARRAQLFQATSVWVENTEYASGGVAENGAFIVLDVPPHKATLGFNAPGAETAKVELEGVPGTADVFIPDLVLQPGGATALDPSKIMVRIVQDGLTEAKDTGRTARVMGYTIRVMAVPFAQMGDRREYPTPPGYTPLATVR